MPSRRFALLAASLTAIGCSSSEPSGVPADDPPPGGAGAGGGSASGSATGAGGVAGAGGDPGPIPQPDCHPHQQSDVRGAYFRKVISASSSEQLSIHVRGVLPALVIDLDRWFSTEAAGLGYQTGPLDRPSVYLGGRAGEVEVDAGLTWDRVYHTDGRPTFTDLSSAASDGGDPAHRFVVAPDGTVASVTGQPRPQGMDGLIENFAFRAFWRAEAQWHNPEVGSPQNHYFYPGEGFRMQVGSTGSGELSLFINHALQGDADGVQAVFPVAGWGEGQPQTFKRVHSIDQFTVIDGERIGLETAGLEVLDTKTVVLGMRWEEVRILGAGAEVLAHLGCDASAVVGADEVFEASYDDIFRFYEQTELGGETSDILPSGR